MISVIVNLYNNRREAKNTLHSLTAGYQKSKDYEVIVIDNGSTEPITEDEVKSYGPQFSYRFIEDALVSPASVINTACRDARGSHLMVMIDGAHILSPGVLKTASLAFKTFDNAFVATTPFHIGQYLQNDAHLNGYTREVEDELMATVDWKANGYKLFSIANECADMSKGWFGCLFESGCFGIRRDSYMAMGGMDERFVSPGGGMVNLEFFSRAVMNPQLEYVVMVGEGTFHQYHGGVATSAAWTEHPWERFHEEYKAILGVPYFRVPRLPFYMGSLRVQNLHAAKKSAIHGIRLWEEEFYLRPQE